MGVLIQDMAQEQQDTTRGGTVDDFAGRWDNDNLGMFIEVKQEEDGKFRSFVINRHNQAVLVRSKTTFLSHEQSAQHIAKFLGFISYVYEGEVWELPT